jgi:hypothetical protein
MIVIMVVISYGDDYDCGYGYGWGCWAVWRVRATVGWTALLLSILIILIIIIIIIIIVISSSSSNNNARERVCVPGRSAWRGG